MSYRLVWSRRALSQLETAAEWSHLQAAAVVSAMEWLADSGLSLGRPVRDTRLLYWPVPPLGVFYAIEGAELQVIEVVDRRRRDSRQP